MIELKSHSTVSGGRVRRAWHGARRILSIPVVAAAVVATLGRLPFRGDPFISLDGDTYLTVARGWLDGLVPYEDLFADKGPLVYIFLTGEQAVAPASMLAVRGAFLAVVIASAALLAAFVERHAGRRVAWTTAVVYAMACSSTLWEFSNDVNTEQLGLPFMVAAVDLADRYCLSGRWWQAGGAGAALAGSFWVKPTVAFVGPLVLVLLVMRPDHRVRATVIAAFGGLAASAATLAPFAASDALGAVRWSLTTYNHNYVTGAFDNLSARSLSEQIAWVFNAQGSAFFMAALTMGGLAWVLGRHRRLVAISTAWFLLEYAGAKLGVRDAAHYYGPALPACAILICTGADALASHVTGIEHRARSALVLAAWLPLATFLVIGPGIARLVSGADPRVKVTDQVDGIINQVTSRDARIFVAGSQDGYEAYWLTDRNPATRFFWAEDMGASPYSFDRRYVTEVRENLERHPPDAVVIWPDSLAVFDNYVEPAIKRGGLHQVASIGTLTTADTVKIFARKNPPASDQGGSPTP